MPCDTATVIAQFCMGHTAMKQKVQGELMVHTQVTMTIAPLSLVTASYKRRNKVVSL